MVYFHLEEIIKRLGVTPGQLRKIADKMEREQAPKKESENQRIFKDYKEKFLKSKKHV